MRGARESGAATVLAVALVAGMIVLLAALVPVVVLLGAHARAGAAADAAALAGADTALGATAGIPCDAAARVARSDGATTVRCRQSGLDVRVDVTLTVLGVAVPGAARAGPPEDRPVDALRCASDGSVYGVRDRRPPQHPRAADEGGPPCPARRSW
ncbi:MAG TPA: Rv3654c family TadE-like protein [Amnibacterium sp.]|nr:Rv3654c family TadE-like protein [Amnibacterium sp.]